MHLILAYYNIRQRKLHTVYMLINIVVIMMILLVWQTISHSLKQAQDEIIYGKKSQCNVEVRNASKYENVAHLLLSSSGYDAEIQKLGIIDWMETLGKDNWSFVNIKYISLKFDDIIYNGEDDVSYNFGCDIGETKSVSFGTSIIIDGEVFSENDLCEYFYENTNAYDNGLICGRMPETNGEFIMSDYMLDKFGIDMEMYDKIIGNNISFTCNGEIMLSDVRLVGIIDSNIFRCEGLSNYPQIILKATEAQETMLDYDMVYRISFEDYALMETIYGYLEKSDAEIEYSIENRELAERLYIISSSQKLIDKLLIFYGWFLLIILVLNLLRVVYNDMAEKKSNHGMMIVMGMNKADILLLYEMEMLYDIIVAIVISGAISLWLVKIIIHILEMSSGAELCMSYGYFIFAMLLDGTGFGIICLMVIVLIWIGLSEKTPYQMMIG